MAKLDSRACRKLIADTIASYSHSPARRWLSWAWKYFESEDPSRQTIEITENAPELHEFMDFGAFERDISKHGVSL